MTSWSHTHWSSEQIMVCSAQIELFRWSVPRLLITNCTWQIRCAATPWLSIEWRQRSLIDWGEITQELFWVWTHSLPRILSLHKQWFPAKNHKQIYYPACNHTVYGFSTFWSCSCLSGFVKKANFSRQGDGFFLLTECELASAVLKCEAQQEKPGRQSSEWDSKKVSLSQSCWLSPQQNIERRLINETSDGTLPQAYFFSLISKGWKQVIVAHQTERKRLGHYRSRTS